jgi:hypothetical protein
VTHPCGYLRTPFQVNFVFEPAIVEVAPPSMLAPSAASVNEPFPVAFNCGCVKVYCSTRPSRHGRARDREDEDVVYLMLASKKPSRAPRFSTDEPAQMVPGRSRATATEEDSTAAANTAQSGRSAVRSMRYLPFLLTSHWAGFFLTKLADSPSTRTMNPDFLFRAGPAAALGWVARDKHDRRRAAIDPPYFNPWLRVQPQERCATERG